MSLETLRRYVSLECPASFADVLEADASEAGFAVSRSGEHLVWTLPGTAAGPEVLLLSHYDTVWPVGTLAEMPWSVSGDVVRGPGVYDTKAGLVALLAAARRIRSVPHLPVRVLVIADEEVGSPTAGELVRSAAGSARAVLGLEPPHPGGGLKTGRRGSTRFRITVSGVEAHAALDPDAGVNAIDELVDQLIRVRDLVADRPVLLNVGTFSGGGRTNVVAGSAYAELGLRFADALNEREVLAGLEGLTPVRPGASVSGEVLSHRPTWSPTPEGAALVAQLSEIAAGIGQRLTGSPADGAADTNTTGALGVPTVDGLAPPGGGAHARSEWVSASGLSDRTDLLAAILTGLR